MGASASDLPGFSGSLALSLLTLGAVCLAVYVMSGWVARRGAGRSAGFIRVVGRCQLEARHSLYLVEVGKRCFLIGVGEGPPRLLAEIEQDGLPDDCRQARGPRAPLADLVDKLLRRGRG
jgi:flagellar biogenesis protein FliO